MPEVTNKAVFLSYASQDAEAAKRICEALRAVGVEVWFDQSELRGGDPWDQKIRRQIKDCALFIPVVSANTQARREGYFRLEWKLADDRTHLMAKGTPFVVPVCVDGTKDWEAIVPDSFTSVQWTRIPGGEGATAFAERVRKLVAGEQDGRASESEQKPDARRRTADVGGRRGASANGRWVRQAIGAVAVVGGLALWQPWRQGSPSAAAVGEPAAKPAVTPAPPTESMKLATQARKLYDRAGFGRDDLVLAEDLARRATDLEPTLAFGWGVRAHVQAAFLFRGFAVGDEFVQRARDAQSFANRALALQPDEAEAALALGRVATYQRAYGQAEAVLSRAMTAHSEDNRIRRALGTLLRYQPRRAGEALSVLQEAVRRDPRDALAYYDLSMAYRDARDFAASSQAIERTIALESFGSALVQKASLAISWKGDLAGMRAALEQLTPADRTEDRAVYYAMLCGLMERKVDSVLTAAALNSRDYLEDSAFSGPKAWFPALAHRVAGAENSARDQWRRAEAVLRARIQADPKNDIYRQKLATTLAWMDRKDEATREIEPIEAAWREQLVPFRAREMARYYAAAGDATKTVAYLREVATRESYMTLATLRLDPWWDRVRAAAEFQALLALPPIVPDRPMPVPYLSKAVVADTPGRRQAEEIVGRIYTMLETVGYTRETLAVADDLARQATDAAPDLARAWSARARVQAAYIQRTWDMSDKRRQETQSFAARALALDPDDADALIAQAIVIDTQGGSVQAEALLRRAMELRPASALIRRLLATSVWRQGRAVEELALGQENARLFPQDPMVHYDLGVIYLNAAHRDVDRALASFDAALAIEPTFGGAILNKVLALAGGKGDFAAARRALDRLVPAERSEDRAVSFRMWIGLLENDVTPVASAAGLSARPYFEDTYFYGPKAWMLALAYQAATKEALARVQWEAAEREIRARLATNPEDLREKLRLYVTLAWLGRDREVVAEAAAADAVAQEGRNMFLWHDAARYHAGRGDAARAVPLLRRVLNRRDTLTDRTLPHDPWWMKLRGQPEFEALLAEAKARVEAEVAGRK